jgi:hypothetical protein
MNPGLTRIVTETEMRREISFALSLQKRVDFCLDDESVDLDRACEFF